MSLGDVAAGPAEGAAPPRKNPLLSPSFLLFGTGQTISQFGSLMTQFSLSLYVLHLTRSASLFANVLASAFVAQIFLFPIAGVYVDRFPRKAFMMTCEILRGCLLLAGFAIFVTSGFRMVHIYTLVGCLAAGDAFFRPASNSIVPFLFAPRDYVQGNTATTWLVQVVTLLSPPVAALVYGRLGLGFILLVDGITFFVSATCLALMTFRKVENLVPRASFWTEMREGFAVLASSRDLVLPTAAIASSRLLMDPFYTMGIPFLLIHVLSASNASLGVAQSFMVVGGLASPALVYVLKRRHSEIVALRLSRAGKILAFLLLTLVGFGAFQAVLRSSPLLTTAHASTVYFLALFFNSAGFAFLSSHYQHLVPARLLGRFAATRFAIFAIVEPLGLKLYGLLFDRYPLLFALFLAVGGSLLELLFLSFVREAKLADPVEPIADPQAG